MLQGWPAMAIELKLYAKDHDSKFFSQDDAKDNPEKVCCIFEDDGSKKYKVSEKYKVGTGFLIGPDLVLTCRHVVRKIDNPTVSYVCKFDLSDGEFRASAKVGRLLATSDPAPWEERSDDLAGADVPGASYFDGAGSPWLDFALLRLDCIPGGDGGADEDAAFKRGWFELSDAPPPLPEPSSRDPSWRVRCVVYQWPELPNSPLDLKMAAGGLRGAIWQVPGRAVEGTRPVMTRLVHEVPTGNHSSGSPVVWQDRVIGLHQAGGQVAIGSQSDDLGRCVPAWEILRAIGREVEREPAAPLALAWKERARAEERRRARAQRRSLAVGALPRDHRRTLEEMILATVDRHDQVGRIINTFRTVKRDKTIRFVHILCRSLEDEPARFTTQLCWALAAERGAPPLDGLVHPNPIKTYADNLKRASAFDDANDGAAGIGSYPSLPMEFPPLRPGAPDDELKAVAAAFVDGVFVTCARAARQADTAQDTAGDEVPVILADLGVDIGPDGAGYDPMPDATQIQTLLAKIADAYRDAEPAHAQQHPPLIVVSHRLNNVEDDAESFNTQYRALRFVRDEGEGPPIAVGLKFRDIKANDMDDWREALDMLPDIIRDFDPDPITGHADETLSKNDDRAQMRVLTRAISDRVIEALKPQPASGE